MPEAGELHWSTSHAERLRALEVTVTRMAADAEKFDAALREVRQASESMQKLLGSTAAQFERLTADIRATAEKLVSASSRVEAIELENRIRLAAEQIEKVRREERLNAIRIAGGLILAALSLWGGRIGAGLSDLLKLLPGAR